VSGPVLSPEAAAARIAGWRAQGKIIVAASGSFDILHGGHRNLLSEARGAGDRLIVLVNSDASVRAYKGPGRPFTPEQDRAAQIAALADVHFVVDKTETKGRTSSTVRKLRDEERIEEIARMIGGVKVGDAAKRAAAEMLRARSGG